MVVVVVLDELVLVLVLELRAVPGGELAERGRALAEVAGQRGVDLDGSAATSF